MDDEQQRDPNGEHTIADYDASGTGTYAVEQEEIRRETGGAAGAQTHMGESVDTPGLAGDLTKPRDDAAADGDAGEIFADDPRAAGLAEPLAGGATAGRPATTETADLDLDEELVIPLHEEVLVASTVQRDLGAARIAKLVVEEEQVVDVPLTEERVRVMRRTIDRDLSSGEVILEETSSWVPVMREEVELRKRVRVAEEVRIGKDRLQRTERVAGVVRKERLSVES